MARTPRRIPRSPRLVILASGPLRALLMVLLAFLAARPASAQIFENIGTRAQGMGGAFVAVADDATASWWNPAGLATGATVNVLFEHGRMTEPDDTSGRVPASQTRPNAVAAAFPSLGVSYYRLHISQIRPLSPTESGPASRQDQATGGVALRAMTFSQFGTTVGQSLGDHLVVGSTIKVVRGGAATGVAASTDDALEAAEDLDVPQTRRFDLDVGVMASVGRIRAGLSVKNVTEPDFGTEAGGARLERQARAGVAYFTPGSPGRHALALAFDADLTRTATIFGDVRHVAGGAEAWLSQGRLGLRGGLTANTVGEHRPAGSAGASFALMRGVYIDASRVWGSDETLRAWSTTVRLSF